MECHDLRMAQGSGLPPSPGPNIGPGWYGVGTNPNEQAYWDGHGWTTRRRWGGASWVESPFGVEPPQAPPPPGFLPPQTGPRLSSRSLTTVRPPPLSTGMRVGYLAAVVGFVALAAIGGFFVHNTDVALTTPLGPVGSAAGRPSAAQLVVGNPITLPSTLFEANRPGSTPLVTPAQATDVATAMWRLWETAQVAGDTRALTQLIAPGALLESTLDACVNPKGQCAPEASPRTFSALVPIVPVERSYPLYFLAEFDTTELVANSNSGINQWAPWVELQILTKASPREPWMLSFDSGYNDLNLAVTPPFLPFNEGSPVTSPGGPLVGEYNLTPTSPAVANPMQFLPLLAAYYQSYKDTQGPPASSPFVANGVASQLGQSLATTPEGSVYTGVRNGFHFAADPGAGQWEFSVQGGYPMECGSVRDTSTQTAVSGLLYQNPDETNYGAPLAPGGYRVITTRTDHETCVYPVAGGLDAIGYSDDSFSITGQS